MLSIQVYDLILSEYAHPSVSFEKSIVEYVEDVLKKEYPCILKSISFISKFNIPSDATPNALAPLYLAKVNDAISTVGDE